MLIQSPYCDDKRRQRADSAGEETINMTDLNAMLPDMANEKAFINSVVFGTSANRVTPRNFSSIPEPSKMASTTSTRISVSRRIYSVREDANRLEESLVLTYRQ